VSRRPRPEVYGSDGGVVYLRTPDLVGEDFDPRYLHLTGQLHKGATDRVVLQLVNEPRQDAEIPGGDDSFGTVIAAHGTADVQALRARGCQ
jgi:hypothetical protein